MAIGASAGGLDPIKRFFDAAPDAAGAAFLAAQHLDPRHVGTLAELLGQHIRLPVKQAADGDALTPDAVWLIAPGTVITVEGNAIRVRRRPIKTGEPHTFDAQLHALAESRARESVAVTLGGAGSDGAHGAGALKAAGDSIVAQDPGRGGL